MIGSPATTFGTDVPGISRREQARFLNPTRDVSIRTLPKKHGGRDSVEPFIRDDPDGDSDPDGQGFKLEPENSDPG